MIIVYYGNVLHYFTCSFSLWECAVKCLGTLDVLISLATYRYEEVMA